MLKSFPFAFDSESLFIKDFILFSDKFKEVIVASIPTCQGVHFFDSRLIPSVDYLDRNTYKELNSFAKGKEIVTIGEKYILCKLTIADGCIVCLLTGVDEVVLAKMDLLWVSGKFENLVTELKTIKRENIDHVTGLFNLNYLQERLTKEKVNVLLFEITPKARSKNYFEQQIALITEVLNNSTITGSKFYLGHLIFGIVISNDENAKYLTKNILHLFRKESIKSVHLGISGVDCGDEFPLDRAWSALFEARSRGNFTFCDYTDLISPSSHKLYGLEVEYKAIIQKKIKSLKDFSVVIFQSSADIQNLYEQLSACHQNLSLFKSDNEILAIQPCHCEKEIMAWVSEIVSEPNNMSISAGVSYYPNKKFTKTEVILQARKALQHTLFYGDGTCTVFNSVSLNISGDIYYGEGNLSKAIKEYSDAVYCDATNINALNSLGVAYAMNGSPKSMECFDTVLRLDKNNFLAHYNKAFTYETRGQLADAVLSYEFALACIDALDQPVKQINLDEIKYQLGILSNKVGKWSECIELLLPFVDHHEYNSTICHYLGLAYGQLGNYKEAIRWFQRSPRNHLLDAAKYSYLGYYYLLEGEGDNIAQSLCEKAVNIDPDNHQFKLHLAAVYFNKGEEDLAVDLVRKVSKRGSFKSQMTSLIGSLPH